MSLRLLELTVANRDVEQVPALLEAAPVIHVWTSSETPDGRLLRILLDAECVEALSDALVEKLGSSDGFRLISLAVEATLPPVAAPAESPIVAGEEVEQESPGPQRISREELYEDLAQASRVTPLYAVMVALSTVVAAVGLIRGDVAIIIGAMVIAPLLGPNVALSLACTLGDPALARRSLRAVGLGVAIAAALSLALGMMLAVDPRAPELAGRTQVDLGDVILALAAGAAGSLAFTSGVPAVVVGVMVAVALLPPLVAAGLLAGAGHGELAGGALMLVLTNVTCVNLAAVATFLLQKVRPRTWREAERARLATGLAVATWIVMLVVLLSLMLLGKVGGV